MAHIDDLERRMRVLEKAINPHRVDIASPEAVTLKEYFNVKLAAVEQATDLAAKAMEKRLEGMNEFRDTLRDQASRFVTREEMDSQLESNRKDINELKSFRDRLEGKASASSVYIAYGLALLSIVLSVIGLLTK